MKPMPLAAQAMESQEVGEEGDWKAGQRRDEHVDKSGLETGAPASSRIGFKKGWEQAGGQVYTLVRNEVEARFVAATAVESGIPVVTSMVHRGGR